MACVSDIAGVTTQARQPRPIRLYCDLGTNRDEGFMIWNHSRYAFCALPVTRRAACVADSPRRIAWQTGDCADCAEACVAAAPSIRTISSADLATRVSDWNSHLIRRSVSMT